jgi:hypothetical protein
MAQYLGIAQSYRERLLKVLGSNDIYAIMKDIDESFVDMNANECRIVLLKKWNDDIRDRVMKIVADGIEYTPAKEPT